MEPHSRRRLAAQNLSMIMEERLTDSCQTFSHDAPCQSSPGIRGTRQQMDDANGINVAKPNGRDGQGAKISSGRPLANMIDDDSAPAKDERSQARQRALASDDLSTSEERAPDRKHSQDQSAHNALSSTSRSSSIRRNKLEPSQLESGCASTSTNQTVCRDSNDNLVLMDTKSGGDIIEQDERANNKKRSEEARDECHMDFGPHGWAPDKQSSRLQKSVNDACDQNRPQRLDEHALGQRAEERCSVRKERPVSNLIRRDDSWHSSLSLNQVGNNQMQGE